MVSRDRILDIVSKAGEVTYPLEDIMKIGAFMTEEEVTGFESLMLISSGHRPVTEMKYTGHDKLINWCKGNDLKVAVDDYRQLVTFKTK